MASSDDGGVHLPVVIFDQTFGGRFGQTLRRVQGLGPTLHELELAQVHGLCWLSVVALSQLAVMNVIGLTFAWPVFHNYQLGY